MRISATIVQQDTKMDFIGLQPSLEDYWRSIILFGRNSASYKFSLAKSLLELAGQGQSFVTWEDLAQPFSKHITAHLQVTDKQGTSNSSKFLDACRQFNSDQISNDELLLLTTKYGFQNVIEAFHRLGSADIEARFFTGDRRKDAGIVLTDNLYRLWEGSDSVNLPYEVEARWSLVETAWNLDLSRHLVAVEYLPNTDTPEFFSLRRRNVTSCRDALNGYQKGRCFYCFRHISVEKGSEKLAQVDHFLPFTLAKNGIIHGLDGIWNLVLACQDCNSGKGGKSCHVPELRCLKRLHKRNEFFISSHHPLRETLIYQTGHTESDRHKFLQFFYDEAKRRLIHTWKADEVCAPLF